MSIGTPHFSLSEFAKLAEILDDGEPFHPSCTVWISTSRDVLATAQAAGFAQVCEASGAKIVVDTCTYLLPILAETVRTAMTTPVNGPGTRRQHGNQRGVRLPGRVHCLGARGAGDPQ